MLHGGSRITRTLCRWAVAMALLAGTHDAAFAQMPAQPAQGMRRDWWFKAPGGSYGLVEIRQLDTTANPSKARSRTSLLVGPWRWTFEVTAPQFLTIVFIPTLVTAFTWGWIRTRRR